MRGPELIASRNVCSPWNRRSWRRGALLLVGTFSFSCVDGGIGRASAADAVFVGAKIGGSTAWFRNADYEQDSRLGLNGGLFLEYGFHPRFAARVEALYMMKGTAVSSPVPEGADVTVMLDYLEFPVLAKVNLSTSGSAIPNLYTGASVSRKVRGKLRAERGGETREFDYEDWARGTEYAWIVGGGLDLPSRRGKFTIEIRYSLALTTAFDADPSDSDSNDKNQVVSLLVGYGF